LSLPPEAADRPAVAWVSGAASFYRGCTENGPQSLDRHFSCPLNVRHLKPRVGPRQAVFAAPRYFHRRRRFVMML
jgi:hypothetical protein